MSLRPAARGDIPEILSMIRELADYEREPDAVKITAKELDTALFGDHPAAFVTIAESEKGEIEGFALWFLNFSTWEGVGIYLEDLYVRPRARGTGQGKALLRFLACTAVERGYARVDWSVLRWNEPSIGFYRSLGAIAQDEWLGFRLSGQALRKLAQ